MRHSIIVPRHGGRGPRLQLPHNRQHQAVVITRYYRSVDMRVSASHLAHFRCLQTRLLRSSVQSRGFSCSPLRSISNSETDIDKQTISNGFNPMAPGKGKKEVAVPRPSASVLLVSPQNQFLLLQRVKQSSSFASAHVFPGGNVSTFHDGEMPGPDSPERHVDSEIYRMAAIRETFEESGIVLARNSGFGRLIEVPEAEREEGRRLVHSNKIQFEKWLASKGGKADTGICTCCLTQC